MKEQLRPNTKASSNTNDNIIAHAGANTNTSVEGNREREIGRKGGGTWDSQGGGEREKKGEIMQHCAMICNRKIQRGSSQQIQGGNRY